MKYPIDQQTTETFFGHLIANDRAQRQIIQALTILLQEATDGTGIYDEDEEWYIEAKKLLQFQTKLQAEHETRIFNENNGYPETAVQNDSVNTTITDPELNAKINEHEAKSFGEEMSEEELTKHFGDRSKTKKVDMSQAEPFKDMTLEEIKSWEAQQNNNNDLFKVAARVKNLARGSGATLTPVGEALCNSFVHVAKDLYDFAETITDKSLKIALIERVRKHEGMPGSLIAAVAANVRVKK